MSDQTSIIGSQPFLRRLPADCVERLASMSRHITLPAGSRLFEENTPAHKFWLIDAGQIALDALVPGVGLVVIEQLGRGDVAGLGWLGPPFLFGCGAVCTQPLQAYEFDAAAVRAECERDPAFGYAVLDRFAAVLTRRLQVTRRRLLEARSRAAA